MLLKSRYDILMGRPGHEIPDPVPPKRGTVVYGGPVLDAPWDESEPLRNIS